MSLSHGGSSHKSSSGVFTAKYHGVCHICQGEILPGERVKYDEEDTVVHATDCNPYARRVEQRSASVCDKCFLTKPCECDE